MSACKPSRLIDLSGKKFGRLTALSYAGEQRWLCRCDCGSADHDYSGANLRSGTTTSCGCFQREDVARRTRTHGHKAGGKYTPEYICWSNIIARCENENHAAFANYGGRGIRICESWRESFDAFLADVGARPSDDHSLDRIDNDRGYEPGNVRWATGSEQAKNRRERPRDFGGKYAGKVVESKELETPEAVIQQNIRLALGLVDGLVLWRNQIGTASFEGRNGKYTVPYGVGGKGGSDLVGIMAPHGRWFALEVKRPGGRPTREQLDFIAIIRSLGGFATIVHSVEEARNAVDRARKGDCQ